MKPAFTKTAAAASPAAKAARSSRRRRLRRRTLCGAVVAIVVLVAASGAAAHAIVSPPVAKAKVLQQFTLSVPTEKEGTTTREIELRVPSGFAIDSFEPPPAPWKMSVESKGSGENAVVQTVTWTNGNVRTGEDAVFRFNAVATKDATYSFATVQRYADGSVVRWIGPETSDTPIPTMQAVTSLGGGGGSSTLDIVAIVLGALGLVAAIAALGARAGGTRRVA